MIYLIGHRGVGKTKVLKSLESSFVCLDLDLEISRTEGKTVADIFNLEGEEKFRLLELSKINEVTQSKVEILSLGAGCEIDKIPKNDEDVFIWLKRVTDESGRIFLDRPRLNNKISPIAEFKERFADREVLYKKVSDFEIYMMENDSSHAVNLIKSYLSKKPIEFNGFLTYGEDKTIFNTLQFEYRTDLTQLDTILSKVKKNDLVSIRSVVSDDFIQQILKLDVLIDIPIEMKKLIEDKKVFYSSHSFSDVDEVIKLSNKGYHVKWAPLINDFKNLMSVHHICKELNVSFLPRSLNSSRWQWYRALNPLSNKIKFFRFSKGSDLSQPFWFHDNQVTGSDLDFKKRGCVLGDPVKHSYSPAFHKEYFKGNYFNIQIQREEISFEALKFLTELGFNHFSITAPLKDKIADLLNSKEPVNTLYFNNEKFSHKNTDSISIDQLSKKLNKMNVCIWGAGAIGTQFQQKLDNSVLYSVRKQSDTPIERPFDVLLWCAGKSKNKPGFKNLPKIIYDIDYSDDSIAKEYALENKIEYVSGLNFFNIQALEQQKWWTEQTRT